MSCGDIFLGLLAVLFPPIAVWIKRGLCSADSLLNILLCVLGYLPGLLHAWYIIAQYPDPDYEPIPGDEEDRVTYYYVSRDGMPPQSGAGGAHGGPGQAPPGAAGQPDGGRAHRELQRGGSAYGTLNSNYGRTRGNSTGQGNASAGQGSAEQQNMPPSYTEAVKGDNKVQSP
ncbi:MAG: hypothetical protein MMC23_002003 [Stictis urceolatum]|nr:hypothetical protein [Stictis urceolata]